MFRIGSFNVCNAGQNTSEEKISTIAKIIENENFDIVALQEVFCQSITQARSNDAGVITAYSRNPPVSELIRKINTRGKEYKGYFAAPPQARNAKEGYVFLWNSKRLDLPKTRLNDGTYRIFYPRIFNQYKIDRGDFESKLIRNPLLGRFVPVNGQPFLEIRIINTHIRFSSNPAIDRDTIDEVSLSDAEMRKKEFNVLSKTIYGKVSDKIYGSNEAGKLGSIFTIMIGDYNLNLKRLETKPPYLIEEFCIDDRGMEISDKEDLLNRSNGSGYKQIRTFQDKLTTIKRITEGNEEDFLNKEKYCNNYDHYSYDINRFSGKGIHTESKRVEAVENYCSNDFIYYRKKISDHLPISFGFDTNYVN